MNQSDAVIAFFVNQIHKGAPDSHEEGQCRTEELREALTREPNATEDNKIAAEKLALSTFSVGRESSFGPVVLPSQTPISMLMWALEDTNEIPLPVQSGWPQLTLAEWKAAMRFVVRVLTSIEI